MRFGTLAFVAVIFVGCDVRPPARPARARGGNGAKLVELAKQAESRIKAAAQNPAVSEEELAVIKVLEKARQSLALTEQLLGRDLSENAHSLGGELMRTMKAALLDGLEDLQAENETHRTQCLKKADECEKDFPDHAKSLRDVAAKRRTQDHITKLQLYKLRKQLE